MVIASWFGSVTPPTDTSTSMCVGSSTVSGLANASSHSGGSFSGRGLVMVVLLDVVAVVEVVDTGLGCVVVVLLLDEVVLVGSGWLVELVELVDVLVVAPKSVVDVVDDVLVLVLLVLEVLLLVLVDEVVD